MGKDKDDTKGGADGLKNSDWSKEHFRESDRGRADTKHQIQPRDPVASAPPDKQKKDSDSK